MTVDAERFTVELDLAADYRFTARFDRDELPALELDELPPLGAGAGPNPVRLLAAAVGHCLGASLAHCLRRSRVAIRDLRVTVEGTVARNERGRLRVAELNVTLAPDVEPADRGRLRRCVELFEEFCTVTASVRQGIAVNVTVPADATAVPAL